MKIWHVEQSSDREAQQLAAKYRARAQQAGEDLVSSSGFGSVPPVLVRSIPDGVEPDSVFPGSKWVEYKEPATNDHT